MIKYRLICNDCETTFDSWFSSSKEYERLKKKNFLNCHICNSLSVEKTLMSPNVFMTKNEHKTDNQIQKYKKTKKIMLRYQKFIEKNFDYVGKDLSRKVRKIYYDKESKKAIYGTTTPDERKELADEGIDLLSIPWVNKDN